MKKILIALDFNQAAERVAEAGYVIAKAFSAEVILIHVMTEASYYAIEYSPIMGHQGGYTSGTNELVADIKKKAEDFLAATVKHLGDNNIKTVILKGETENSILNFGNDWEASLIVIGSHTHKGLERLFVTDLAAHILKHSKIPLLIIPTQE